MTDLRPKPKLKWADEIENKSNWQGHHVPQRYIGKKYRKHYLASGFRPKFNSTPFLRTRSGRKPIFFTFPRRQIYTPPYVLPNRSRTPDAGRRALTQPRWSALRKLLSKRRLVTRKETPSVSGEYCRWEFNFHGPPALAAIVRQYFITARAFLLINHSSPVPFNYVPDPANVWLHFHRTSN